MNVLCDRHHAGLLFAMQRLFEDRLGGTLYVPVGHDWWDEGYWRFGQVFGDDRLAQQYLVTEGRRWIPVPGYEGGARTFWLTRDPEYPTRDIRGVSLAGAREMEWDFVVASVQENQQGFARFAQERGAKYVYQIGNTGQQVDWALNPLAIVTAEAEIKGNGVRVHQEYDKDWTFAHRPLINPYSIASFVNCFDRIPEEWKRFRRFEKELRDFTIHVYGHDGRNGLVQPTSQVAYKMADHGFAWHDKPQGDGFGHIIHYWASIGRPLIGTKAYYKNRMAEPLWEDGVTAITLDGKSRERVVQEIRDVAADPARHLEMCRAIRAKIDELVDFDAEEQLIRQLLGLPHRL